MMPNRSGVGSQTAKQALTRPADGPWTDLCLGFIGTGSSAELRSLRSEGENLAEMTCGRFPGSSSRPVIGMAWSCSSLWSVLPMTYVTLV